MRSLFSFAAIVALTTGCVSTNAIVLGAASTQRARVLPANVRVYRTPDQVKAKYEEVAMLNSKGESNWTNEKGMIESMQRKAGELGANGIILDAINEGRATAVDEIVRKLRCDDLAAQAVRLHLCAEFMQFAREIVAQRLFERRIVRGA